MSGNVSLVDRSSGLSIRVACVGAQVSLRTYSIAAIYSVIYICLVHHLHNISYCICMARWTDMIWLPVEAFENGFRKVSRCCFEMD